MSFIIPIYGRIHSIKVKPNSPGAAKVLKSNDVANTIARVYGQRVLSAAGAGAKMTTIDRGMSRRVVVIYKEGTSHNKLVKHEAKTREMVSALALVGKTSRSKYETRLKRNRKARTKAQKKLKAKREAAAANATP